MNKDLASFFSSDEDSDQEHDSRDSKKQQQPEQVQVQQQTIVQEQSIQEVKGEQQQQVSEQASNKPQFEQILENKLTYLQEQQKQLLEEQSLQQTQETKLGVSTKSQDSQEIKNQSSMRRVTSALLENEFSDSSSSTSFIEETQTIGVAKTNDEVDQMLKQNQEPDCRSDSQKTMQDSHHISSMNEEFNDYNSNERSFTKILNGISVNNIEVDLNKEQQDELNEFLREQVEDEKQQSRLDESVVDTSKDNGEIKGNSTLTDDQQQQNPSQSKPEDSNKIVADTTHISSRIGMRGSIFKVWKHQNNDLEGIYIQVLGADKRKKSLSSFIVFCIHTKDKLGETSAFRRYKEFSSMRQALKATNQGLFVPPIPEKKFFQGNDEETIKQRVRYFDYFVKQVAKRQHLYRSQIFQHFLRSESQEDQTTKYDDRRKSYMELNLDNVNNMIEQNRKFFSKYLDIKINKQKLKEFDTLKNIVHYEIQSIKDLELPKLVKGQQDEEKFQQLMELLDINHKNAEEFSQQTKQLSIMESEYMRISNLNANKEVEKEEIQNGMKKSLFQSKEKKNQLIEKLNQEVIQGEKLSHALKTLKSQIQVIQVLYESPKYLQTQRENYEQFLSEVETIKFQNDQQQTRLNEIIKTIKRISQKVLYGN